MCANLCYSFILFYYCCCCPRIIVISDDTNCSFGDILNKSFQLLGFLNFIHSVKDILPPFNDFNTIVITRAAQGVRVIKCNRFPRQKGGHGPRRSMRGPWKLGTRPRSLSVLRRIFQQESGLILWCHIQRCRSFSEGVGPRIIVLESQPGKQSSRLKRSRASPIYTKILTKKKAVNDGM